MFESKSNVFFIAGLFFFALSVVVMGLFARTMNPNHPQQTLLQIAGQGITREFVDLAERYPEQFQANFPAGPTTDTFAEALGRGHKIYIAEGCWHCHTQQIRHVSNEDRRWGPGSHSREYQNVLQTTALIGRRRVGPDLIRETARSVLIPSSRARSAFNPASRARHSNDWHVAHFYKPTNVSPTSVMPEYPWYFDDDGYPTKDGMSLITYVQWLGSWLEEYPYFEGR